MLKGHFLGFLNVFDSFEYNFRTFIVSQLVSAILMFYTWNLVMHCMVRLASLLVIHVAMHIPAATQLDKPDLAGSQISTVYSATTERAIKPTLISLKSQEKYL